MEPVLEMLAQKLAVQAPVLVAALCGVWVMGQLLMRAIDGRISDLKDRIAALEAAVDECQRDRKELWERLTRES